MKVAIIELYDGEPNTGLEAIKQLLLSENHSFHVFSARQYGTWPFIQDWDVFISTGGPGDPAEKAPWSNGWKRFMQSLINYNKKEKTPKPAFLICLSFQLFCHHFNLGEVSTRTQPSFGSYGCHLTPFGKKDLIFGQLGEVFQVADFRFYQITKPSEMNIKKMGATILAIEKERPAVKKERALMAAQFTNQIYGTQFHPEAFGDKVKQEFLQKKSTYVKIIGEKEYQKTLLKLEDVSGLNQTQSMILPQFLRLAQKAIGS